MTNYAEIYDHTFLTNAGYQSWTGSPGVRLVFANQERLLKAGRRHLDYGCGAGFVVELLGSHNFNKESHGTDVSTKMCDETNERLGGAYAKPIFGDQAPFEDSFFDLITCFDVLEHVDADDVHRLRDDIYRLLQPNGVFFCNISLKPSVSTDLHGENLHRTIKPADWWDSIFEFDSYEVQKDRMEMTAWKTLG